MKIKFRPNLQGRKLYFSHLSQEWNDYLHPLWNANILNCLKICSIKEIAFIAFIMSDIWWINSFRSIATCPYICSCVNGWFIISFLFLSVIFQWGNDSWKSLLRLVAVWWLCKKKYFRMSNFNLPDCLLVIMKMMYLWNLRLYMTEWILMWGRAVPPWWLPMMFRFCQWCHRSFISNSEVNLEFKCC